MTRKDYVALANAFQRTLAHGTGKTTPVDRLTVDICANAIADALASENARFDRVKFLTACGLDYSWMAD